MKFIGSALSLLNKRLSRDLCTQCLRRSAHARASSTPASRFLARRVVTGTRLVVLHLCEVRDSERGHNANTDTDYGASVIASTLTRVLQTSAHPTIEQATRQHAESGGRGEGGHVDIHRAESIADRGEREDRGQPEKHDHLHGAAAYDALDGCQELPELAARPAAGHVPASERHLKCQLVVELALPRDGKVNHTA